MLATFAVLMHLVLGVTMAKAPVLLDVVPAAVAADICGEPGAPTSGDAHCSWCQLVAGAMVPPLRAQSRPVVTWVRVSASMAAVAGHGAPLAAWGDARAPPVGV